MQSPLLAKCAMLQHCCQQVATQYVCQCVQQSICIPVVTQCAMISCESQRAMASCASVSSSIDTIQASANFPPENRDLFYTRASYSKQPIPELVNKDSGNWTLTLNVPIPADMVYPTLTSFSYTVKYSTANHHWASAVQFHILLALPCSKAIPAAINGDLNAKGNCCDGITIAPQTFEGTTATRLSSVIRVKESDVQGQWNHFTDVQQVPLNVRIVQSSCLYLQLQVSEYPSAAMLRALSVDVSATWLEDQRGKRLMEELREAEKRADEAEVNAAAEEAARKKAEAQQAADDQAKEQAETNEHTAEEQLAAVEKAKEKAIQDANKASSEKQAADAHAKKEKAAREAAEAKAAKAKQAKEHADHHYDEEHKERLEAEREAKAEKDALADAKHKLHDKKFADEKEQAKIKKALENLPKERQCPAGYVWLLERGGYRCKGGHHHVTWEELHAEHATEKKVADDEAQAKIKEALKNLPKERHCPNGYAWVHESGGYRCTGGQHHITYVELHAEHTAAKEVADEKEQEQIKIALKNLPQERQCPNGYAWVKEEGGYRCTGGQHHITYVELHAEHTVAKKVADEKVQKQIKIALKNLPAERHCPNGYAWVKEQGGYRCTGGQHHITYKELHAEHTAAKKVADDEAQAKIKKALENLPKERHCPNGYAWVHESSGYRCTGGQHHITYEELHAEHTAAKKVADEQEQEQIKIALKNLPEERHCPNGYAWVKEEGGYRCTGGQHHITWEELRAEQAAKKVADAHEQEKIKKALENLPKDRHCPNGYAWVQESGGYRCTGGQHHVTLEELRVATTKVAGEVEQVKIKKALENLPKDRHCPNGYAWVQERGGYRCTGGQHHITWEELNAEQAAQKKVADEKDQAKIEKALKNLPQARQCPNGYAWVQEKGGYRCERGGHHVTWEELHSA